MHRFWGTVLKPILNCIDAKHIIEIGADAGVNSTRLARWCTRNDARLDIIDPKPKFVIEEIEGSGSGMTKLHVARSLDVLATLLPADVVLIDGDHNWFTVFNELKIIYGENSTIPNNAPVVILHDLCWPYGRRDQYYDLGDIPIEYRQPAKVGGVRPDVKGLHYLGMNNELCHAQIQGGLRNGVRTAIEDAMTGFKSQVRLVTLEFFSGLMVIVPLAHLEKYHSLKIFLDELEPTATQKKFYAMLEQQRIEGDIAREQIALLSGQKSSISETSQLRQTQSLIPNNCWQAIQRGIFSQLYKKRALLMSPFDMANYTQLLGSLKPRTVFEIGTYEGGRSIWLADSLHALGIDAKIITVDINVHAKFEHSNIEALQGNAMDLSDILTADKMAHLSRPFLVIEDSAHTFATSHAVLEFFNRYLISGDYIVIEDGNLGQLIGDSEMSAPVQAINAFLGKHGEEYEIDFSICDRFGFNTTTNSNGWIKRI